MLEVKPFKQTDLSRCGPASIKMVLGYYGLDISEDEIAKLCNHTWEKGCTDKQMQVAIKALGFKCRIKNKANIEDLRYYVCEEKIPVIVDWFSPGYPATTELEDMPNGHSSVIVDVTDDGFIIMVDPEFAGYRKIKQDEFMRAWFDWREDPYLQRSSDLVLQQMIIIERKRSR